MRDVTDNVTGELPGVEQKRGRGRPRKAHAMTNAERQAAFRARRKVQQPVEGKSVTKRMTVTEMLSDVDAYDECRLEVDALRAELVATRRQVELAEVERNKAFAENDELRKALRLSREERNDAVKELTNKLADSKSVTPSNGNSSDRVVLQLVLQLLALACKGKKAAGRVELLKSAPVDGITELGIGAWHFVSEAIQGHYVPYSPRG
ncbi:hypothetical protein LBW59_05720 [Ralstonia solanacearum]|uniref:Uncharacterized protein n=1 Tax=Ralstonia solanacearum TaxID=305 RepID=A0AAW5ZKL4_RALSL|nr:hypothetical protein [Ralstonia solanacearum]MDB0570274.1 hypothetical protein [Ralstonia solanacearum]